MAGEGEAENEKDLSSHPIVAIYQNADYVSGILQQVHGQPLWTAGTNSNESTDTDSREEELAAQATATVEAKMPLIGRGGAEGQGRYGHSSGRTGSRRFSGTSNWQYTQAFYLYEVRRQLAEKGLLNRIDGLSSMQGVEPGDFVEFSATFSPSQLLAILDIATPELVRAITRYVVKSRRMDDFEGGPPEEVQKFKVSWDYDLDLLGEVSRTATEAIRTDFRSMTTREFYGKIGDQGDSLTAVTICDLEHFVVEDEDRLLDGQFTVLGKVTSSLQKDLPIFARNKLLERMDPGTVDFLVGQINNQVTRGAQGMIGEDETEGGNAGVKFNMDFDSRVKGESFKVVPIAIYA
ncbi:DUF6414 family protein [Nesterenkonia muleiensis]|uniref:DUF6414 family protein n=1 Tax=Nesterenkonia muleiensis TaxID=2282648 RepID=UPI0013001CE3|nr:hypothetical protein [Nesterenkonia muleiensis]